MSIESNATAVLIATGQRHKIKLFGKRCARRDGTTFSSFQTGDVSGELGINHGHFAMLDYENLKVFNNGNNWVVFFYFSIKRELKQIQRVKI